MKIKKIALCLGAGALCAATGGLAAPAIGAAIGGTMGLAGAAATSAGLAALGGGALAAGGAGMAGGVAVVQAVAGGVGVLGAGAVAHAKEKADSKKDINNNIQKETDARVQREIKEKCEAEKARDIANDALSADAKNFFCSAIESMDTGSFLDLRDSLIPFYLTFSDQPKEEIMRADLSEAVCKYFLETASKELKNMDKLIGEYFDNLDSIIGSRIQRPSPVKRGEQPNSPCRAMRYYEKAKEYRINSFKDHIIDYSRIMLCLYAGIISNHKEPISNFDYSADAINPGAIISSMKEEIDPSRKNGQLNRFAPGITRSSDACTFMLVLIMIYKIRSDNM